ncbi:helix-turn-helix transcriptional regulator [Halobacterium wangiae]|uniref:helix-turn-helix transcriptional regulator n=1 Tax=Halobacterium wangiae TaxID=2902623 RepID=UPI001E515965|nr:ArsR family transcriptional regulator [Halobacterium wangiae]
MERSLDEIAYLSRSENRVRVLDVLTSDALTRRELEAETGASQATLSRVLEDFRDRGWVSKEDALYEATAFGTWISNAVSGLQEAVRVGEDLREVAPLLPTTVDGFDVRWLADAEVVTPTQTEPNAPMDRVENELQTGRDVRVLSYAYNRNCLDANVAAVQERGQRYEGVYTDDAIRSLYEEPEWRDQLESILDADTVTISVYDGAVPCSVEVVDGEVHLILRDDQGVVRAVVASGSTPLREWAESLFEQYLEDAEPVDL